MADDFNCEVLAEIETIEIDETHRMLHRIVRWGNPKSKPVFEIRPAFWKEAQQEWFHGKHLVKLKQDELAEAIKSGWLERAQEAFVKAVQGEQEAHDSKKEARVKARGKKGA